MERESVAEGETIIAGAVREYERAEIPSQRVLHLTLLVFGRGVAIGESQAYVTSALLSAVSAP